jgi:hypothetical protein
MKYYPRILLFIILSLLLSGCFRMATYPTVDLSRFTPEATSTKLPWDSTVQAATPTPGLDSITQQALQTYPLWVGSSWVYEYLGFDQEREVTWRVVETVVSTQLVGGHFAAQVERTAEMVEGYSPPDFPAAPEEGEFWLVLVGDHLYRSDSPENINPDTSWLELILPIPTGDEGWFPDPNLRAMDKIPDFGLRTASQPFQQVLPMGGTYVCYNIFTQFDDGTAKGVFCDGIGFVYLEYLQSGQNLGYRADLTGFSLQ